MGGVVVELDVQAAPPSRGPRPPPDFIRQPWRTAFPTNLSLAINLHQDGSPADIKVIEDSQPHKPQDLESLSVYSATPIQKVAFEAYALDIQVAGLMALAKDMGPGVSDTGPPQSDWQKQLDDINAMLEKLHSSTSQLFQEINTTVKTATKAQNEKSGVPNPAAS